MRFGWIALFGVFLRRGEGRELGGVGKAPRGASEAVRCRRGGYRGPGIRRREIAFGRGRTVLVY